MIGTRIAALAGLLAATVLISGAASGEPRPGPAQPAELRVMTWNIQHGSPNGEPDGPADLERVAAVIRAENPDVVTLNEVHDDEDFAGSHGHQPAILADLLAPDGYEYSYYGVSEVHSSEHPGTRGELILSKHPIYLGADDPRRPEVIELSTQHAHPGEPNRRSLVKVTLDVPGLGDVRVYATHLSAPARNEHVLDQLDQTRKILDSITGMDQPVVLAGDFNIRPTDAPNQFSRNSRIKSWIAGHGFVDTWTVVNDSEDGVTRPNSYDRPEGDHPDRRIDYVFASPRFDVRSAHVSLVDRNASDHLAVVTDLRLRPSPTQQLASVLAGENGESGWAQLGVGEDRRAKLTVCKNTGTVTDDGWDVRARVFRSGVDDPELVMRDGGTSRDHCHTVRWSGYPSGTELETCLVKRNAVTECRRAPVMGSDG